MRFGDPTSVFCYKVQVGQEPWRFTGSLRRSAPHWHCVHWRVAMTVLMSLISLQVSVSGSWAGLELGEWILVLTGDGCRAGLTLGPWLRQSPLQLLLGHLFIPHGGVMGRTWAFLPLGLEQQQLQATSSSSTTVAGGSGERGRRHWKLRGGKRKDAHLLPEKPLWRLEWGGPLPEGLAPWSEVPGGLMRGVDRPLPATRTRPPPCSTSSASQSSAPFIL